MVTKTSKIQWLLQNPELLEAIENLTHLLADAAADAADCTDVQFHDSLVPEASAAVNDCVETFIKAIANINRKQ
jgi:hypothetical protein